MVDKEQTNDEMFEDKTDMLQRDKALLALGSLSYKGKMSCLHRPHRSCSEEKERFYKHGEGLKTHQRFSHQAFKASAQSCQGQGKRTQETKYDKSLSI